MDKNNSKISRAYPNGDCDLIPGERGRSFRGFAEIGRDSLCGEDSPVLREMIKKIVAYQRSLED